MPFKSSFSETPINPELSSEPRFGWVSAFGSRTGPSGAPGAQLYAP